MKFFVSCAKGTEGPLRRELIALRIRAPRGETGGVSFEGTFEDAMKVCLWSRVGMRVLLELSVFQAPDAEALYAAARAVPWTDFLTERTTFAVTATVQGSETLRHSGFAALKVKDAIADGLRDALGARPDVAADDPDVAVFLHLLNSDARLYLDMAGDPLHRRGYRVAMTEAPLKETLAAAVLALGHADLTRPFVDPMTGSGTLAIEHALMARQMAPGLRRAFGFERWHGFADGQHQRIWDALKKNAAATALDKAPATIIARDVSPDTMAAARRNAQEAGVAKDIKFEVGDIGDLHPPTPAGTICLNPPYGERLNPLDLNDLYRHIGRTLESMRGWTAVVLCGNPDFLRVMPKPEMSHRLWNGPIEARLLRWKL